MHQDLAIMTGYDNKSQMRDVRDFMENHPEIVATRRLTLRLYISPYDREQFKMFNLRVFQEQVYEILEREGLCRVAYPNFEIIETVVYDESIDTSLAINFEYIEKNKKLKTDLSVTSRWRI